MPQEHDAGPSVRERPDDPDGAGALVRRSHVFASTVRDLLEADPLRGATPHPLTISQLVLLKLMDMNGSFPLGQVAGAMGVSAPAATKNADKLERLGLVVRSASPLDRRMRLLTISAKGRRLVREYERLKAERVSAAIGGFTPSELGRLSDLLERFAMSLLTTAPPARGPCLLCSACLVRSCPVGRRRGGCPHAALAREVS